MLTPQFMPYFSVHLLNESCISTYIQLKTLTSAKNRPYFTWNYDWKQKKEQAELGVREKLLYLCCSIQTPRGNKHSPSKQKVKVSLEREDLLRYKTNPREIYPSSPRATDE